MTKLNLVPAIPELFLLVMACVALMSQAFLSKRFKNVTYYVVQFALVVTAGLVAMNFGKPTAVIFHGGFINDSFAVLSKFFICLTSFFVFVYSYDYVKTTIESRGEYYILGLLSILGMMVLVSAYDLINLFMGIELMSLPIYAMVALRRENPICIEAAMKYFVIGAIAAGMLLYGLSMIYGATKSLQLVEISKAIAHVSVSHSLVLVFGLVFVVVGLAFKFGAVPFHMWVPDVYTGAPNSVTLFIATAPKIAALGLAIRVLVNAMPGLVVQWQQMLIVVSILSMALGNFVAIVQTSFKRTLAYSSIAHMGYMLLGLLTGTKMGYSSALFYMLVYTIMTLGAFGLLTFMSHKGYEADQIEDFKGLSSRNPWLAFMLMLLLFSMAGIPPLVGFMAKLSVLEAVIEIGYVWLAAVALLFAVIGSYYYIRIVKVMYFEEPDESSVIKYSLSSHVAISLNGLAVLLLGIFPGAFFHLCQLAF